MAGVTYIDHVPSAAEIAQALGLNEAAPSTLKMRGLEWQPPEPGGGMPPDPPVPPGAAVHPVTPAPAQRPPPDPERPALALPVAFDSGWSRVSRPSLPYVAAVASVLVKDPAIKLIVEGHTDAAGSPRANLVLSWERALAVFRLLVERHGIDPARLAMAGKGCAEPLESSPLPNARNRRVQFRIAPA